MKYIIMVLVTLLVLFFQGSVKEGFFNDSNDPVVCAKVKKGAYPQISLDGILDRDVCDEIIRVAEDHAKTVGGWETKRHESYPTTDFDTADIPTLKFPIHNIVYGNIIPKMATAYGLDPLKLGISEVFIAKYSAEKGQQKSLGKHVDGSDFSFVIALNEGFKGGGTRFTKNNAIKKPLLGSAIGFCGQSKHQGLKVTSGTRYILAGFLTYKTPDGCDT